MCCRALLAYSDVFFWPVHLGGAVTSGTILFRVSGAANVAWVGIKPDELPAQPASTAMAIAAPRSLRGGDRCEAETSISVPRGGTIEYGGGTLPLERR